MAEKYKLKIEQRIYVDDFEVMGLISNPYITFDVDAKTVDIKTIYSDGSGEGVVFTFPYDDWLEICRQISGVVARALHEDDRDG